MRKYKSTDSHYLEQATCNHNFVNFKKNSSSSSNTNTHPSTKAIIRPIDSQAEEQIPHIRENTQAGEDKQYLRLPDDIFINEEPLYNPSRQHFSIFKSINAYKKVSYTMMDKSQNVVHCFLEEKNPTSIQCSQWSKLADRYSNTLFAPLAKTIQEFYIKREDWNESLSVSTKDESCQILPEYSNSGVINNIQNGHIFLNQFQLAQEREDVNKIQKILSSPDNQQPQIIFRRMFVNGKGTILRSIHINTSFLNMVNFSTEDFLLCTAIRKALPDIFYSLNYMQIMKKALFKIDNSQQQEIFNHSILTANNQQIDFQCRYEGANMPHSKLVILKITNQPSIQNKFPSSSSIEQNSSNSNSYNLSQLNKKRKLFEREDIVINGQQSRILQCAFGLKLEDGAPEETSRSQSSSVSEQQGFSQNCLKSQNKIEQVSQKQQQTNQHINQIEKIFKLRASNY
ncbi:hypothetical protein ABPG72_005343 [Tetrahymena utriculariae]